MWSKKLFLYLVRRLRPLSQRYPSVMRLGRYLGLRKLLSAGDRGKLVLDSDVVIELDLSVKGFRHLYYLEDLQNSPEIALVKRLSDPSGCFVDVGANIGYFSLVAAKYYAQVVAIEPSQFNLSHLGHNINLNPALAPKITTLPFAVGEQAGAKTLFRPIDQPLAASLAPVPGFRTDEEAVYCQTLDTLLDGCLNVTTIKIDTEGAEYNILQGGKEIIQRFRPFVICEISDQMQKRFGSDALKIFTYFRDIGYLCIASPYMAENTLTQASFHLEHASKKEPFNLLFVPSEAAKRLEK